MARLEIMLAHQPPDLRVIDDKSPMPQLDADASQAIELELVAESGDQFDDRGSVGATTAFLKGERAIPISRHPSAMLRLGGRR